MTTTLIIVVLALAGVALGAFLTAEAIDRRSRRREREIVRRITRYLDSLPPARPW